MQDYINYIGNFLVEIPFLAREFIPGLIAVAAVLLTLRILIPAFLEKIRFFIEGSKDVRDAEAALEAQAASIEKFFKENKGDSDEDFRRAQERLQRLESSLSEMIGESFVEEDGQLTTNWRKVLNSSRNRLNSEAKRLKERSTANLAFGVAFSIVAALTLAILLFLFPSKGDFTDTGSFLLFFVPRLTIVLLLQVVAAFFLRMHAYNEKDIEKNKNQITNLETKYAAIQISEDSGRIDDIIEIIARSNASENSGKAPAPGVQLDQKGLASLVDALGKAFKNPSSN